MMKSAAGPLAGVLTLIALPLLGRLFLTDGQFAFWALLATVSTTAAVIDLGGPLQVSASLSRPDTDHGAALRTGLAFSAAGSLGVGTLGALVWLPYSHLSGGGVSTMVGAAAMLAVGVAGACRAVSTVVSGAALTYGRYALRSVLSAATAAISVVVALGLLAAGAGIWSLPAATAVGGVIGGGGGLIVLLRRFPALRHPSQSRSAAQVAEAVSLARTRIGVAALSSALTQADRWVVGAIGGPALLATYEVCARVALLPKMGVLAMSSALVPGAATLRDADPAVVAAQSRLATLLCAALSAVGAVGASAVAWVVLPWLNPTGGQSMAILFGLLLLGHSVHAVTAAGTALAVGLGRARSELGYLSLACTVATIGWVGAIVLHSPMLAVASGVTGLVTGSLYYLLRRPYLVASNVVTA